MEDKIEYWGEWYLPRNPDKRISGLLEFTPFGKITLKVFGSFNDSSFYPNMKDEDIILGITSDSKKITLSRCNITNIAGPTLVFGEEIGKAPTVYSIIYLFVGLHVKSADELVFDQISSEICNLGQWIGISGFEVKRDWEAFENKEASIFYKLPESIVFDLGAGLKGSFIFMAKNPDLTRYQKSIMMSQKVEFEIESKNKLDIPTLLKHFSKFQNFLSLALYRGTYPLSITLYFDKTIQGHKDIKKKKVEFYFSMRNIKKIKKEKLDIDMLFTYKSLHNKFPLIIKNWYKKYENLEPAFNLLFEQLYRHDVFTENTFLNLAQAAETFHSRVHDHTKMLPEEYKKMKTEILQQTGSKYHSFLQDLLNFGNYLTLQTRLSELLDIYSNESLDCILGDKDQFILDVKNSRNYFTHYNKRLERKKSKGISLYYLSEKLKILLVCGFLMEIGIPKEEIAINLERVKSQYFNHIIKSNSTNINKN